MGTSLTNEQIRRLERVAKEVVICYDGDNAGVQATNRAIQLLQENSHFDLSIVSIPEKLDPDEYVRKYGAEAFQNLANHGRETRPEQVTVNPSSKSRTFFIISFNE